MRDLAKIPILAALLSTAALTAQQVHPDELVLKPRIDAAIAEGVEHLFDTQLRDGSWGVHGDQIGGQTALCAYALLKCGVPMDHPSLRRAFGLLDNVTPTRTYATGCMLLAYGATGVEKYDDRMRELLGIMLRMQHRQGTWAYPTNAPDLSNTQYAALGLWAAGKAGLEVPAETWERLIRGTLAHQEAYRMMEVGIAGRTGVSQREVAGFQYRANGAKANTNGTGTMTTAGVSILKICEIGLGKKLRGKARKELARAMEAGLSWIEANFSVTRDQKPDGRGGRWLLYYLYGMERVGGLTRREQFGEHWWYVEGARELLKRQKNGGWGQTYDTCFALLFLRRATVSMPMTGGGAGSKTRHLFAAGDGYDNIRLRGAGQQPLAIYIEGFGELLLDEHGKYGLRVLRVEYLEGDRVLAQLAADPTKAWNERETFIHRCLALPFGKHVIRARVTAIDPEAPPEELSKTVTITSQPMEVEIRDVFEPWMRDIAAMQQGNLLKGLKFEVTASSQPKNAARAADGRTNTHWLCDKDDATPTLTLTFDDPVRARRLILTQPLERHEDLEKVGVIRQVEVCLNNSRRSETIDLNPNALAPTEYELPRSRLIRSLTLKVISRGGKADLPVGFAEVVLEGRQR